MRETPAATPAGRRREGLRRQGGRRPARHRARRRSQPSVDRAVAEIIAGHGRIDVIVHNAGHMAFGPAEAFTPEQFAELYDVNVLSTQRVNRAALPHMRKRGRAC